MERRKLFSDVAVTTRRRLFSDVPATERRKLFSSEDGADNLRSDGSVVLVCQDCGYNLNTAESTSNDICPNCGGRRFNHKTEISTPLEDVVVPEEKTYSRRRLFSSLTEVQPNVNGEGSASNMGEVNFYQCIDCKHEFEDPAETPSGTRCPNCGGNRVLRLNSEYAGQCEFSDKTDEFLKEFSGQTVDMAEVQKTFSEDEIGSMINEGYAIEDENGGLYFSEVAFSQKKLFSELVISVSKELGLEPVISKESLIDKLLGCGRLPEKSIILIKKAHNMVPSHDSHDENYLNDSGISRDLRLLHGGETMGIRDFLKLLDEQYNDAPEDILDDLVSDNVIKISGSKVEILK